MLKGVDIKNVGRFTDPKLEKKKQEYIKQLKDPDVKVIKTGVGNVIKSEINYGMLSRGEAATHRKSHEVI